jgi:ribonuclease P protein 3
MMRWPKDQMNFVRKNSSLFLTEDSSQDDPFMLYAALKSGPKTNLCSRDLMRGHSHLLDPESKRLFRRWQQQHQYSVITTTEKGEVLIKEPIAFELRAHKINDHWHIPFSADHFQLAHQSFELPTCWICLKIRNNK